MSSEDKIIYALVARCSGVLADEGFGRIIPIRLLNDMKNKFKSSFGDRARSAYPYAFNADFQGTIRRLLV